MIIRNDNDAEEHQILLSTTRIQSGLSTSVDLSLKSTSVMLLGLWTRYLVQQLHGK